MRVLITGANGFVGSNICDCLIDHGYDVIALVRRTSNLTHLEGKKVEIRYGEITKRGTLRGMFRDVETVIHVAATIEVHDVEKAFLVNGEGTRNVLEVSLEEGVERFIYISTQAVTGPSGWMEFKTEDEENPVSFYGRSKKAGEIHVLSRKDDIFTVILRPPAIFGERDRETFNLFLMLKRGMIPISGYREKYFPMLYIRDFVKVVEFFIGWDGYSGGVFHVSDGKVYPYTKILRYVAHILNMKVSKPPITLSESFIFHILPLLKGYLPGIINRDKMREMKHPYWFMSTSRLRSVGKFEFTEIGSALSNTIEWYRKAGLL